MTIIERPSPNFNNRPAGTVPSVVVLHGTAGKSVEGDLSWMAKRESGVSYHYVIGPGGDAYQLVDEGSRAWHAGRSEWEGREGVNDFSIGIGLSNPGPVDADARNAGLAAYPTEQILAVAELVVDICMRHRIPWRRILTHAQVSPGRKTDPWLHFPWGEFMGAALSYAHIRGFFDG